MRTSVDLTAAALEALRELRQARGYQSNSAAICAALEAASNHAAAAQTMRAVTELKRATQ